MQPKLIPILPPPQREELVPSDKNLSIPMNKRFYLMELQQRTAVIQTALEGKLLGLRSEEFKLRQDAIKQMSAIGQELLIKYRL